MGFFDFIGDIFGEIFSWFGLEDDQQEESRGTELNKSSNIAGIPVVYGTRKITNGIRVFMETDGYKNNFLYMAIVLCEGEIDSIGEIFIDDKPVTDFGNVSVSSYGAFDATYTNDTVVVVRKYTGTDAQTYDTMLGGLTNWTSNHTLSGLAYLAVRIKYKPEKFSGRPEVSCIVRGKKVLDTRTATTAYSTNRAVCLRDYLTNTTYGKGLATSLINDTAFEAAADDCDATESVMAQVNLGTPDSVVLNTVSGVNALVWNTKPADAFALTGSNLQDATTSPTKQAEMVTAMNNIQWAGSQNAEYIAYYLQSLGIDYTTSDTIYADAVAHSMFECNIILDTEKKVFDNVKTLLAGMRGQMPYLQGQYKLLIEKDRASVGSIDHSNIIGGIKWQSPEKKNKYNRVTVKFINPNANWKEDVAIFPEPGSATETAFLLADDGTELHHEITMPGVTNLYQARELARIILYKSRAGYAASVTVTSEALAWACGDVITVTHTTPGWVAKEFLITKMGLKTDGTVTLTLLEHTSSIYTYDATDADLLKDNTTLPDPFTVATPTSLVTASTTTIGADGTLFPAIDVSWTAGDDQFIIEYEVQYKASGDSTYRSMMVTTVEAVLTPLTVGLTYNIRVRSLSTLGVFSDWLTGNRALTADTTPPSLPTGVTLITTDLGQAIEVNWTNPTNNDFHHVELYYHTADVIGSATSFDAFGTAATIPGLIGGTTYYVWLKSVDNSGNTSAATTSVNTAALVSQLEDDVVQRANIIAGEIVQEHFYIATNTTMTSPTHNQNELVLDYSLTLKGDGDIAVFCYLDLFVDDHASQTMLDQPSFRCRLELLNVTDGTTQEQIGLNSIIPVQRTYDGAGTTTYSEYEGAGVMVGSSAYTGAPAISSGDSIKIRAYVSYFQGVARDAADFARVTTPYLVVTEYNNT